MNSLVVSEVCRSGNLSNTSWKMKLLARTKDRTIGEKVDSKEKKVEKSKRIKHTT